MIRILIVVSVIMCLTSGICGAAPSFLSTTGNIMTPNDSLLGAGEFSANYDYFDIDDVTTTVFGANVGVTQNLELGIARIDKDAAGVDAETILNAKYLVLPETVTRPSLLVGVVDAGGELDAKDDAGLYVVIGKNLTPAATGLTGEPVEPLRGYLGIGTGVYDGMFAGLDCTISQRVKIIAEFLNGFGEKNDSIFNAGLRVAITDSLRGDIALIDGGDIGFGISYTKVGL